MTDRSLRSLLGARLRALRRTRGLTQERAAEELGMSPRYFAGIERGEHNLTLDSVDALAARLGVPAGALLVEHGHPPLAEPGRQYRPAADDEPTTRSRSDSTGEEEAMNAW